MKKSLQGIGLRDIWPGVELIEGKGLDKVGGEVEEEEEEAAETKKPNDIQQHNEAHCEINNKHPIPRRKNA